MTRALALTSFCAVLTAACGGSSSPDAVCKKMGKLMQKESAEDIEGCKAKLAEMKKQMGDENYTKMANCIMKASDKETATKCALEAVAGGKEGAEEYMAKAKTTEAREFVKKMYDGARSYYMDPAYASATSMEALEPSFPASVGPTPPKGTCCKGEGGKGKCAPDQALWSKDSWVALQFSVDDPHYYSYEFQSQEKDGVKSFTVYAYGDLDCDGEYSTFSMYGEVKPGGEGPKGNPSLARVKELE
jgi:hypothetical protein